MKEKIGNLTKIRTGKLDANASSTDGIYPFFTCSRETLKISTYSYDCECVLIAGNGDLNVKYYNGKFDAYQRTYIIEGNGDKRLYIPYLYYFMDSYLEELRKQSIGGVIKYIKLGNLTDAFIELPSIELQKHFARILNEVEALNALQEKTLSKLDELVKSRFVEMFGNRGENPFGFPTIAMGNVYKFQYGKGNNIPEDKGDYPCYGSNGIVGHHTEYNSEDSPIIGHIGAYAGIVNWGKGKHYVTYNGVICKLINDQVNPVYGYYLLQIQDYNAVAKSGAAQPFVSYKDLDAPVANIPPLELQNRFAAFVAEANKSKLAVKQSLEKLETLKKSLMQQYFG